MFKELHRFHFEVLLNTGSELQILAYLVQFYTGCFKKRNLAFYLRSTQLTFFTCI